MFMDTNLLSELTNEQLMLTIADIRKALAARESILKIRFLENNSNTYKALPALPLIATSGYRMDANDGFAVVSHRKRKTKDPSSSTSPELPKV